MLNVIHQYAPDATMNELAEEMQQKIPVIGDTNQASVTGAISQL